MSEPDTIIVEIWCYADESTVMCASPDDPIIEHYQAIQDAHRIRQGVDPTPGPWRIYYQEIPNPALTTTTTTLPVECFEDVGGNYCHPIGSPQWQAAVDAGQNRTTTPTTRLEYYTPAGTIPPDAILITLPPAAQATQPPTSPADTTADTTAVPTSGPAPTESTAITSTPTPADTLPGTGIEHGTSSIGAAAILAGAVLVAVARRRSTRGA